MIVHHLVFASHKIPLKMWQNVKKFELFCNDLHKWQNVYVCWDKVGFVLLCKAGHVCGDNIDLVDGQPTGSVRVSFGYMSTFEDCQKFLKFVAECFVEKPVTVDQVRLQKLKAAGASSEGSNEHSSVEISNGENHKEAEKKSTAASQKGFRHGESKSPGEAYALTNIYIYPIKSCGPYEVWGEDFFFSALLLFFLWLCPLWFGLCAVIYAGAWLAVGSAGFTVRQGLDGGKSERRVSESEERDTFMPHSPTSPPSLEQIVPSGIRSERLCISHWEQIHLLTSKVSIRRIFFCFLGSFSTHLPPLSGAFYNYILNSELNNKLIRKFTCREEEVEYQNKRWVLRAGIITPAAHPMF